MTTIAIDPVREQRADVQPVPFSRVINVELRKMFDTRSGFWLMSSIVITGAPDHGRDGRVRARTRS